MGALNPLKAERLPLALGALYRRYGYTKYRMDQFESYDLYRENKSFLGNDGILTFTDGLGRLMALRPDVTVSIVKNANGDGTPQRLYYTENVFRMDRGSGQYREIRQLGVEYLGADGAYPQTEVLTLALESLAEIGGEYLLAVGHMGLVTGVLDALRLDATQRTAALEALRQKNPHAMGCVTQATEGIAQLERLLSLSGPMGDTLQAAQALRSPETAPALDELAALWAVLQAHPSADRLRLDCSIIQDVDYYNGTVFQGFLTDAACPVLSGGRYDRLMHRFHKNQSALGFALYLGELERSLSEHPPFDVELLLLYGNTSASVVSATVRRLMEEYDSVRAEAILANGVRARQTMTLSPDGSLEVYHA